MPGPQDRPNWIGTTGPRLVERTAHRHWLHGEAQRLIALFQQNAFNPAGGFFQLDEAGRPLPPKVGQAGVERQLHETTRMVHCFSVAQLLGTPGADRMIDHGMEFIWRRHRDSQNGGYFWGVDDETATDPRKQAYGHAFVLLAASSPSSSATPMPTGCSATSRGPAGALLGAGARRDQRGIHRGLADNQRLPRPELEHAPDRGRYGGLRGDRRAGLSRDGREHRVVDHRPPARQQGWRVAEHFTPAGRSTAPMPATRCSVRPARRRAMRWNGAGS